MRALGNTASVRHGDRREEETSVETEHQTDGTATEIVGFCFLLKPIGFNLCPYIIEAPLNTIAMDMLSLLTCKTCLCYSMIDLDLVRWLQGLERSYITTELMMMVASQWKVYFT